MTVGAVAPDILAVIYLNLFTSIVLFSAMSLGNRLELPAGQADVNMVGIASIASPLLIYAAMRDSNPWGFGVPFFNGVLPAFLAVPIVQLLVAYLSFHVMERRLLNPLLPSYSKFMGFVLLLLVDAVTGAAIYFPPVPVFPLSYKVVLFCLIHLAASVWLMTAVTPWRETLESWVWRFRGRLSLPYDLLLGERSANSLILMVYGLMGVAGLWLFVLLPAALGGDGVVAPVLNLTWKALALTVLLILALGTVHQRAVLLVGRNGAVAFFLLGIILDLPPHMLGLYYQWDGLMAFSPSAHFLRWFRDPANALPIAPVLVVYTVMFVLTWVSFRARMRRLIANVDLRLRLMGAKEPAVVGGA
jgi:hypothetical protein